MTLDSFAAAPAPRFPLSAIVLTHNEEVNIGDCLVSLAWADDVIVVDSGSLDQTVEIARQTRVDVRVFEHPFLDFGDQRNWALDTTEPRHPWVLFLDADERSTPEFAEATISAIGDASNTVGYYLCCRNRFLGRWIKHCTYFPSWQLRLLKLGAVRFRKEGHGQREIADGPLGYIFRPYEHHPFSKGIDEWITRHNGYTTNEVELIERLRGEPLLLGDALCRDPVRRRRCLKRIAARIGFRPILRFFHTYLYRGGFLDGRAGLVYCLLRIANDIHLSAKLTYRRWQGNGPHGDRPSLACRSLPGADPSERHDKALS